jgi:hypothetical protein
MPLLGIPLDPDDVLGGILAAPRDFVALAVLGGRERAAGFSIGLLERLGTGIVDAVADVLDNHLSPS